MIFTTGYTAKNPNHLKPMLERLNAVLVDIRYSPASKVPYWRFQALKDLLGENYYWVKALGNRNYKNFSLDIEIDDLTAGLKELKRIQKVTGKNLVLLCSCKYYEHCHRKVVVRACGQETVEITDWRYIGIEVDEFNRTLLVHIPPPYPRVYE